METPFQLHKILFPTDFSQKNAAAARYAAGLAGATKARIFPLHVVPLMSAWHGASESYYDNLGAEATRGIERYQDAAINAGDLALQSFVSEHFSDLSEKGAVRTGGVADTIVEYADEIDADLIMMTTRGFGPLRRFLIGAATAKVLHDSARPLWTTPHIAEVGDYHPPRHIICATDYRVLSPRLLVRAEEVTRLLGGRLTIVSAIPCPMTSESPCSGERSIQEIKRNVVAVLKRNLAEHRISAALEVVEGSVGEVVRSAAVFAEADLIVIGHGHLGERMGHLRTHAYEIIWNAPCPVLAI
jgi:nucleotide-binding universal stress UspA family protein